MIKLLSLTAVTLAIVFSCAKKVEEEEASTDDPFDGYACDTTVSSDLTDSAFVSLLQSGASSASVYRVCIAAGVKINDQSSNTISISNANIEIRGANTKTASLSNTYVSTNTSTNVVKFVNLKFVNSGGMNDTLSISGSASVSLVGCVATSDNSMGAAVTAGNNSRLTISESTITSSEKHAVTALAQNGAQTAITVNASTLIAKESGLNLVSQNGSLVTATVNGNTFKTNAASSGMHPPAGISSVAQNNSTITVNDTSTSPLNFFCNVSGTADTMSTIHDTISQNSSTINGTFSISNTVNGVNTINTCP